MVALSGNDSITPNLTVDHPNHTSPNSLKRRSLATPKRNEAIRRTEAVYFAVGITNSAPLPMLSGQRCMIDFCLV